MNAYLRILLVEDDLDHAAMIQWSLDSITGLSTDVVHVVDCNGAMNLLDRQSFDAILADFQLGGETSLGFIRVLRARGDRRPIVILTAQGDHYIAVEAMRAGANDYLDKIDLRTPKIIEVIERIVERIHELDLEDARNTAILERLRRLTPREHQVMELMIEGKTTHEIAHIMDRSENTIKIHRSHVLGKLKVHSPAELTRLILLMRNEGAARSLGATQTSHENRNEGNH